MSWESVVLRESADWVSPWKPPGAELLNTERIRLYVNDGVGTVIRADPSGPSRVEELLDEVLARATELGAARVLWTVRPGDVGAAVLAGLRERGGEVSELIDICAWDLRSGLPVVDVPDDVMVRPVQSRDDIAALQRVDAEVWGYRELTAAEIDEQAANLWPGRFGAFVDDRAAGSAGYGLVTSERGESVARLFGAGVMPRLRGRGAYRGLLAARLEDARTRGATLALVHARSGTSGPILRRIGFAQIGRQTVVELPVAGEVG